MFPARSAADAVVDPEVRKQAAGTSLEAAESFLCDFARQPSVEASRPRGTCNGIAARWIRSRRVSCGLVQIVKSALNRSGCPRRWRALICPRSLLSRCRTSSWVRRRLCWNIESGGSRQRRRRSWLTLRCRSRHSERDMQGRECERTSSRKPETWIRVYVFLSPFR